MSDAREFRFDHAVVFSRRLAPARRDWESAGFSVAPGGRHEGSPTENALVPLADGSYVELLAGRSPLLPTTAWWLKEVAPGRAWIASRTGFGKRLWRFAGLRRGLVDWAIATRDLAGAVEEARERGLAIGDPVEMGRTRADGVSLRWKVAIPDSPELPFLIEDLTPREQRVPPPARHASGATGISAIEITVRDVESLAGRFERLLGLRVARTMSDFANVVVEKGAAFVALGGVRVIIVPARPGKDPRGVSRLWISLAPRSGAPPVSAALTRTGMVLSPAASVAKDRA